MKTMTMMSSTQVKEEICDIRAVAKDEHGGVNFRLSETKGVYIRRETIESYKRCHFKPFMEGLK